MQLVIAEGVAIVQEMTHGGVIEPVSRHLPSLGSPLHLGHPDKHSGLCRFHSGVV